MGKSTAGLGRELGLNSQETNILLRDAGYLEGEPGDWRLTEKGQEHAEQQHWDVSSPMHAGYVTTRWDDSVLEGLGEVSPERKQQIDDEISARRAELRRQRQERQTDPENISDDEPGGTGYADTDDDGMEIDGKAAGIVIALIAGGYVAGKVVKWAKPHVEKWWNETAHPKLVAAREQLVAKFKKSTDNQQEDTISDNPKVEEIKNIGEKDGGEKS